jgi:uncharacterized membrane protein YidH (DUF202 family)
MSSPWPADPGAQPERTLLAWVRTALATAAVLLAVGRELTVRHPVAAGAVLACAPIAVVLAVLARRRYLAVRLSAHPGRPGGATLLAVGGGLVMTGGWAVLLYVFAG